MKYIERQHVGVFLGAVLIGLGLSYVHLTTPERVFAYLNFEQLGIIALGSTVLCALLFCFKVVPGVTKRPFLWGDFEYKDITPGLNILFGGVLFGIGWALAGMSPTTAFVAIGNGLPQALFSIIGIFLGSIIGTALFRR